MNNDENFRKIVNFQDSCPMPQIDDTDKMIDEFINPVIKVQIQ